MYPPRKGPIPNQDKNTLVIQKDLCLPSHVTPFSSGFKSLRNNSNDDNPETTDTSRTDKDDTSRTNWDYSIENVKAMKKQMMMTNTNRIIRNIKKVMKLLSTQPKKSKHWLNGWCLRISKENSYNIW